AVAHERGPVELADHAALVLAQARLLEGRFGIALEERAVGAGGEAVEEAVEAKGLGAPLEVEDVGAFELLDSFQLRVHAAARGRALFVFFAGFAAGSSKSATAMAVVMGR